MSGGVDSSVAALRLHRAGYEVVGVTLHLWDYPGGAADGHARCCAPEDRYDAARVADLVGFPHYTFDRRELFLRAVVAPFVDAYVAGETPSPCTACNRGVKLAELFAIADRLGAAHVATGHYARVERDAVGRPWLHRGADRAKDQSYFLYATQPAQLERLLFPLGASTKGDVRAEAVVAALPGAGKGESQELCFVGAGAHAYTSFVEGRAAGRLRPGRIVDEAGREVGTHAGIHRFTIGQRKGVGVALGEAAFVTDVEADTATVRVGRGDLLAFREAHLDDVFVPHDAADTFAAEVRVRNQHAGTRARVVVAREGTARVTFDEPVRAVARGQVAVFHDGDRVLGGGRIARAVRDTVPVERADARDAIG